MRRDLPFLLLVPESRGPRACPGGGRPQGQGLECIHFPRGSPRVLRVPKTCVCAPSPLNQEARLCWHSESDPA